MIPHNPSPFRPPDIQGQAVGAKKPIISNMSDSQFLVTRHGSKLTPLEIHPSISNVIFVRTEENWNTFVLRESLVENVALLELYQNRRPGAPEVASSVMAPASTPVPAVQTPVGRSEEPFSVPETVTILPAPESFLATTASPSVGPSTPLPSPDGAPESPSPDPVDLSPGPNTSFVELTVPTSLPEVPPVNSTTIPRKFNRDGSPRKKPGRKPKQDSLVLV